MNLIKNYYTWSFNAIVISKIVLKNVSNIPEIKKLSFFFFLNLKCYKKNLLLFYLVISLIFGGIMVSKNKELRSFQIFSLVLKNKKIKKFMFVLVNNYLPLLNTSQENGIKQAICLNYNKIFLYRINFFTFPIISELDILYTQYEQLQNFINNYKLQIDIYIKTSLYIKNSLEFLVRMFRFPCFLFVKNKII